jgi:hypothetical protein
VRAISLCIAAGGRLAAIRHCRTPDEQDRMATNRAFVLPILNKCELSTPLRSRSFASPTSHQSLYISIMRVDDFKASIKEAPANRVGMKCSNPNCDKPTSGPREEQTESINIGVAAHISAASEGGPRYDQSLSSDERQSIGNGIWLYQSYAKLIDSDCRMYSVDVLNKWKNKAEEIARNALEGIAGFDSTHPSKNHLLFKNGSEFDSWHKDVNLH